MPKNYFACANTSSGFVNLFPNILKDMEKVFIIKGGPGTGKSTLMKKVGKHFEELDQNVEYIHCSSDCSSLDGVIIDNKIAIADGTAPHIIEPTAVGAREDYLSFSPVWNSERLKKETALILDINAKISLCYKNLYFSLKRAGECYAQIEKIYAKAVDYKDLDYFIDRNIEAILRGVKGEKENMKQSFRFLGALTDDGWLNYIENLTEETPNRYFLKGKPGSGKSQFLKRLSKEAKERGVDTEIYRCSLDPDKYDMVVIPSYGISVFDATSPHQLFPSRENDVILDFYEKDLEDNLQEEDRRIISTLYMEFEDYMAEAREYLRTAHTLHDNLEKIYIKAVDFELLDAITKDLIEEIEGYIINN